MSSDDNFACSIDARGKRKLWRQDEGAMMIFDRWMQGNSGDMTMSSDDDLFDRWMQRISDNDELKSLTRRDGSANCMAKSRRSDHEFEQ